MQARVLVVAVAVAVEFEVRDQINQEDAIIDNDMAETIMIIIAQE